MMRVFVFFLAFDSGLTFRLVQNISDIPVFVPYEKGFVGYYGDPDNPERIKVNPGNPLGPSFPRRFEGVNARRKYTLVSDS